MIQNVRLTTLKETLKRLENQIPMTGFHLDWFFSGYLFLNLENIELSIGEESRKTLAIDPKIFIYMYNIVWLFNYLSLITTFPCFVPNPVLSCLKWHQTGSVLRPLIYMECGWTYALNVGVLHFLSYDRKLVWRYPNTHIQKLHTFKLKRWQKRQRSNTVMWHLLYWLKTVIP